MNQDARKLGWRTRTIVRCTVFAATVVLLVAPLSSPQGRLVVSAVSPFTGIASSLATRVLGPAALAFIPVLVLALVYRRWFCRWACPVGLMNECAGRVSPVSPARCKPVPRLGLWLVLLSFSAATVGYPLLLWLDPLAVFSGTMGLTVSRTAASFGSAFVLATILLASFVLPGVWCLKVCPLGATQELLAIPRCWFGRREASDDDMSDEDELIDEPVSRRGLLTGAVGATCAVAGVPLGLALRSRGEGEERSVLRPPGARAEWQFGQLCLRCGNCVRSCPSRIITTGWRSESWSTWLTPEITFESGYCLEDCVVCLEACPSGALSPAFEVEEAKPAIGVAVVLMDSCLLAQGRECRTMCLDACPYEAITLHEWTWEDDRRYPIVAAEKCPGCGACQVACTPMDAIVVRPLGTQAAVE